MRYVDKVAPGNAFDAHTFDEVSDAWKASGDEWSFEFRGFPARREVEAGEDCFVVRTDHGSMKLRNGEVLAFPVGGGKLVLIDENVLSSLYEVVT